MSNQYIRLRTRAAEPRRCALLEQLLARAETRVSTADWRAEAFDLIAPPGTALPSIAGAALCSDLGAVDAAWVCLATPVHYVAEMTTVRLPEDGILTMTPAAAATLAADFDRIWQDAGIRMRAAPSAQLYCLFDRPLKVTTSDPRQVLGQPIEEYLPHGEDAAPLRRLISETEMWLFEHSVNSARGSSGQPAINGLWFWGGGAPLAALPTLHGWVGGDDVFFNAFGARERSVAGSGVVAVVGAPGSDHWQDTETRWLRPAIEQLRAGGLSSVEISAENYRFIVTAQGLRRFWRRKKPWWEFLT